jgi:hypothetical protein
MNIRSNDLARGSGQMSASLSNAGILMLDGEAYRSLNSPPAIEALFDGSDGRAIG